MRRFPDDSDTYNVNVTSKVSIVYAFSLKYNVTRKTDFLTDIACKIEEICFHEEQLLSEIFINAS